MKQYFGKYRGTVESEPDDKGRVQVSVKDVLEGSSSWATPSVPYAGPGVGFFAIPPPGAKIWVEFEGGDPDRPIWTGCFWGDNHTAPNVERTAKKKVFKTETATITLDDTNDKGSITIETKGGMKIVLDAQGIELTNGQGSVKLTGNQKHVAINIDGLEVT